MSRRVLEVGHVGRLATRDENFTREHKIFKLPKTFQNTIKLLGRVRFSQNIANISADKDTQSADFQKHLAEFFCLAPHEQQVEHAPVTENLGLTI
jgi:hypothetical protein